MGTAGRPCRFTREQGQADLEVLGDDLGPLAPALARG